MIRLFAAIFALLCLFTPWRAAAHPQDEDYTISVSCDLKKAGRLEQTVIIPVWFLVQELYGEKATVLSIADKEAECRTKIIAWMTAHNPLIVDGVPVTPEIVSLEARSNVFPELKPFPGFIKELAEYDDNLVKHSTGTQIILAYQIPAEPKTIAFRWTRQIVRAVPPGEPPLESPPVSLVFFNEDTYRIAELSPDEPEWVWRSEAVAKAPDSARLSGKWEPQKWRVPVAAPAVGALLLVLAPLFARSGRRLRTGVIVVVLTAAASGVQWYSGYGCVATNSPFQKPLPRPTPAEARTLFSDLLLGVYKAFDYNKDADIYDALSQCVDGPLLEQVYRDVHGSLVLDETEGGAICRVDKVDVKKVDVLPPVPGDRPEALRLSCAWTVRGIVSHWNHTHTRANAYEAEYTLAPCASPDGPRWKITGCKVTTQKPAEVKP